LRLLLWELIATVAAIRSTKERAANGITPAVSVAS
jgi:hypothetical protein